MATQADGNNECLEGHFRVGVAGMELEANWGSTLEQGKPWG